MRQRELQVVVAMVFLWAVLGCEQATTIEPPSPEYVEEIDAWKARRDEGLRQPDGWLTLVGLSWLEAGENSAGSDPGSDVIFPPPIPPSVGVFRLEEGVVSFIAAAGVEVEQAGDETAARLVRETVLQPDTSGDPTVLGIGSVIFYLIDRGGRLGIRMKDSESEALRTFTGMEYYELDPSWRIEAAFEPFEEPGTLLVPNVLGTAFEEPVQGTVSFEREGRSFRLTPTGEMGKPMFFVFGDVTNGRETYGGGRFLSAEWPSENGIVLLDFNRAYSPPCVFSPFATCPLPAAVNKLDLAVTAGEKSFGPGH